MYYAGLDAHSRFVSVAVLDRLGQVALETTVSGEALQVRDELLGVGHVQLAIRLHEIVLGVDIPKNHAGHVQPPCYNGPGISQMGSEAVNR